MRGIVVAAILTVSLAAPAIAEDQIPAEIKWVDSYAEGAALAQKTDRHLVVNVFSPT